MKQPIIRGIHSKSTKEEIIKSHNEWKAAWANERENTKKHIEDKNILQEKYDELVNKTRIERKIFNDLIISYKAKVDVLQDTIIKLSKETNNVQE